MTNMDKWKEGKQLTPDEEGDYLKDLCAFLREQQTLTEPIRDEKTGGLVCEVVPDEIAAHTADIIEELWKRIQDLKYELKEAR